jgi:hypothetical protein
VDVFCTVYADAVPPDGLEEVYRLHERTVDGMSHLDPNGQGHLHRPAAAAEARPKRTRAKSSKAPRSAAAQ